MKKNKFIIFIACLLTLSMLVVGCSSDKQDNNKENAVAIVNGQSISQESFDQYLNYQKKVAEANGYMAPDMWGDSYEDGRTYEEIMKEAVLEQLVLLKVQDQMAEEANVEVTNKDVDKEIDNKLTTDEQKKGMDEFIETMGITKDFFRYTIYRSELLAKKYIEEVVKIEDEKAETFYNQMKAEIDSVKASHILVATEEEAKDIIKQVKDGADFAEIAKEKSLDKGSAVNGGDLGYFTKSKMVKEFADAAFALEVGQISEPVKSQFGYHIIKVTDRRMDFESNKDDVVLNLKSQKFNELVQQTREKAEVEILIELAKPKAPEAPKTPEQEESKEDNNTQDAE